MDLLPTRIQVEQQMQTPSQLAWRNIQACKSFFVFILTVRHSKRRSRRISSITHSSTMHNITKVKLELPPMQRIVLLLVLDMVVPTLRLMVLLVLGMLLQVDMAQEHLLHLHLMMIFHRLLHHQGTSNRRHLRHLDQREAATIR